MSFYSYILVGVMESFLLKLAKHLNLVARASDIPCILKKGEFGEFLSCIEKTYTKLKEKKKNNGHVLRKQQLRRQIYCCSNLVKFHSVSLYP